MSQTFNIYKIHTTFKRELLKEIGSITKEFGDYILSENKVKNSIWAQDILFDVKEIKFESISQAARELKKIHPYWAFDSLSHHRRAKLIQDQLNYYKHPELDFMGTPLKRKYGCWIMVDQNTIWASADTRSPIPFGIINFKEDKKTPPSRAYLKLWEVFTVLNIYPQKKSKVIDLGSCPGGWSWVLSQIDCDVVSVDKAPLDPKISKINNIHFLKKDAFKLDPKEVMPIDWLFSDIICEPSRLLDLIYTWKEAGIKNFVCTIKFKGKTDFDILEKFKSIDNSRLWHLYHNKHEITWILA